MRDSKERLRDMLEAIDNIDRYAIEGKAAFERNELIQIGLSATFRLSVKRRGLCQKIWWKKHLTSRGLR